MYRIELVVGHSCRDGYPLSQSRIAEAETIILRTFAALFRGGRMHREHGSYQTHDGRTILEQCTVALCETMELGLRVEKLEEVARRIALALEQESVLLTITQIDGRQQWLSPARKVRAEPLALPIKVVE
jgi:hypothetical protein